MSIQSMTAEVGQSSGSTVTDPSSFGSASPTRASAPMAASLRRVRSTVGSGAWRCREPSTKRRRPTAAGARTPSGSRHPASWVTATT